MRKYLYLLLLLVAAAASPAEAVWREARSPHFVIYSEQSAKDLQEFSESLERYDKGLRFLFSVADDQVSQASRVTIFIVPNTAAVRKLMGPKTPPGIAGFYRNWPGGAVAFVPRPTGADDFGELVLRHEYAHHFLLQNFSSVFPAWFTEGFAEFASTAERQKDGSVNFGMAAQHRASGLLMASPLPIEKLLSPTPSRTNSLEMDKFYGRGWLLCHYLIVDPARRGQLTAYIKRLNSGESSLDAARATFGDLKRLDKDLTAYLRRPKLMAFGVPASFLPIGKVIVRELGPAETAMMDVRIRSKAGVNREMATEVAVKARKAAAAFPNDVVVQTALAEAELDAGNFAEAEAAADRAIAADPKAIDALTYKGIVRMRLAEKAGKTDAESWRDIRKWFASANRLDPDDPEPLTYFFMSYLRQGIEPTPNALTGAVRALELTPQDSSLRMTLVQHYLRHGKATEARGALLRLASDPHGGRLQETASNLIAALDSGGTEAALGVLGKDRNAPDDEAGADTKDKS